MNFTYRSYYAIVGFENVDYGYEDIENFVNQTNHIVGCDKSGTLFPDWTVCFYLIFRKYSKIAISKKGNTLKNEKNKEYNIIIPIPTNKEVSWGLKKSKFGCDIVLDERKMITLPVDCNQFSDIKKYVIHCVKEAIVALIINGFMIEGKKIEFSKKTMYDMQKMISF